MSKLIPLDCEKYSTTYRIAFITDEDDRVVYLPRNYYTYADAKEDIFKLLDLGIDLVNIQLHETLKHKIIFDRIEE